MRVIDLGTWPRKDHFAKFGAFRYPHFSLCAEVDLTTLRPMVKARGASLTSAVFYIVARAANDVPEFRQRIRGDAVVEHETVHPSVTVLVGEDLFGFAQVDYCEDFLAFAGRVAERFAAARERPTLMDEAGRDDLLFMTALPWISFTSFSHPMPTLPADSIPRFAWGKAEARDGRIMMPLAVQGHHGLIDGIHMARYYKRVEGLLADPATWLAEG